SRRSQRSSASNDHHNSESELYSTVAKHQVIGGNTRRLLEKAIFFLRNLFIIRTARYTIFCCSKQYTVDWNGKRPPAVEINSSSTYPNLFDFFLFLNMKLTHPLR